MKVGANVLIPLLFVKIIVQSNVLQKNRHASWDMMTMVVLSQNNAPLEVRNKITMFSSSNVYYDFTSSSYIKELI